jgi:methylated-DNA-[protein]-cysteine S-methyltransferase
MKTTAFESSAQEQAQDHQGATVRAVHEHGRNRDSAAVRRGEPSFTTLVAQARADSPLGGLLLAATANGLAGVWFDGQKHHPGVLQAPVDAKQRWIGQALAELDAYWHGRHRGQGSNARFRVPLDPQGSAFQREVWLALRAIPHGRTLSYGALAERLGRGPAVRAVGGAVGRNPLSVIVPCHRVIGAAGALTGYAGGLHRKRALLMLEGAAA